MKDMPFLLGHKFSRLDEKSASTGLNKNIAKFDHDIRAPWSPTRAGDDGHLPKQQLTNTSWATRDETWDASRSLECFFQHAGLVGRASSGAPRVPAVVDASRDEECQRYKELLGVALNRVGMLEKIVAEQSAKLTRYFSQVADLSNKRNQRAAELEAAQEENNRLTESLVTLQETANQRDTELAVAIEKLTSCDNDRLALQTQLDNALKDSMELSEQLLDVNMMLNDRETSAASTQEQLDRLTAALTEAQAQKRELAALIEEIKRRHCNGMNEQRARFEDLLGQAKGAVAKRDQELKELEAAHSILAGRYDCVVGSVGALENAHQQMQDKIDAQARLIEALESELDASRETAERQIDKSNAELQRMRAEHAVAEHALEEICKDISLLLPDLAMRRNRTGKPRYEIAMSLMKAA